MWCETSGLDGSAVPGPDLGIHLGMSGRIVVTAPDGWVAEGGDPPGRDAQPRKAEWDRFTLEFGDGGRLALFDKRRLGRIVLNPDIDALGPDAAEITPAQFRAVMSRGTIAVKARLLDQSKLAGVGNLLADEILWQAKVPPGTPVNHLERKDVDRLYRALRKVLAAALATGGGAHTGDVIAARRPGGSCPRCGARDGARHGRRPLHLVVLPGAGRSGRLSDELGQEGSGPFRTVGLHGPVADRTRDLLGYRRGQCFGSGLFVVNAPARAVLSQPVRSARSSPRCSRRSGLAPALRRPASAACPRSRSSRRRAPA